MKVWTINMQIHATRKLASTCLLSVLLTSLPLFSAFAQNTATNPTQIKIRDAYRAKELAFTRGSMYGTHWKTTYGKGQSLLAQEFPPETNGAVLSRNPAQAEVTSEHPFHFSFDGSKSYNESTEHSGSQTQKRVNKEVSDDKNTINSTTYQDGNRDVSWYPKRSSVGEIQRFWFYYPFANAPLSDKKISELMAGSLFAYAGQQTSPVYGKLAQYHHSYKQGNFTTQVTLSFALERNYALVSAETNDTKNRTLYQVLKLEKSGEHYFPQSFSKVWNALNNEETTPIEKDEYTVSRFEFGKVDRHLFEASLKSGDNVLDMSSNLHWTEGKNGERIYRQGFADQQGMVSWGWLYTASVTTLLILTILGYIRWKRQQSA